jgi:hypothetical protein
MVMSVRLILRVFAVLIVLLSVWPEAVDAQTIRGHGPRRHGSSSSGRVVTYYYSPWYSSYHPGWGYYGYYPYYAPYGAYGYGSRYYVDRGPEADLAFLDTDVSPEKASVFLDGEYVGVADNFDGYPRFLAVEPGRHTIRFEAPGRQTVTRRIRVPRGAVVNFDFTLRKQGARGAADSDDEEIVIPDPPEPPRRDDAPPAGYDRRGGGADLDADRDDEDPGLLRLRVTPADASVYIDGEFMGTGSTLSRLHGSLRLDGGRHTIEVARPGYRSQTREVRLSPGEPLTVEIDLERE